MSNIEVKLEGLSKKFLQDSIDKTLTIICENIISRAQTNLILDDHVATGYLLESFGYTKIDFSTYEIYSSAPYANFIENGTLPHDIFPVNKKALRWRTPEGFRFSKHVKHTGFPPSPFFEPAYLAEIKEFPNVLARVIAKKE